MYIEYFENKIRKGIRHLITYEPGYFVGDFGDALDELVADNKCGFEFESDEETVKRLLNTKATALLTERILRWNAFAWYKYFKAIG